MRVFFKMFFVFAFISNVVLAYGNTSLSFTSSTHTEYTQPSANGFQVRDNQNDTAPHGLIILAEEEETETNEEFLHATIFIVAFFQSLSWDTYIRHKPTGDYAHRGKKARTQSIYTFIETFRI